MSIKKYKIAVAGTGYVGLSIATLLSQKVSWCTGYDNKGQHFEKWVSCPRCYDNKT